MSEYYQIALMLLGIGMVTVFLMLWVVVLVGDGIILFVNRFIPVSEENVKKTMLSSETIDSSKIAVITAAVKMVTQGKAQVVKIEKK